MKIVLIATLVALAAADVSHLLNHQHQHQQQQPQQQYLGYQYQNPAPENSPQSSYGVPQASVLGNSAQSFSSSGSATVPQLLVPTLSGPSHTFNSGLYNPSAGGLSIQTYNGFSSPAPSAGLSSFQVSSPTPTPNVDLSSFQVSSPAPSVDLSGFQGSTLSPTPSVNLVQYSQPSSSYQFLSKLSQPTGSVPSFGLTSINGAQFGSDASLNSGVTFGSTGQVSSDIGLGSNFGGSSFVGQSSGGKLDDSFGVVTNAADSVGSNTQNNQEAEVSKHLYFFGAPEEEEEEVQARVDLPAIPPKKSYKIIFIKAPTYRNQATITIPAPPQNEEKTLVYVLVKKPEGQPKVRFQDAAPTQPTKPEVFFIKYKTQKEAESAVAQIQSKHGASGHVIANLPAGTQPVVLQPEGGVSVSSTPSTVSFGGNDIGLANQNGLSSGSLSSFESRISGDASQLPESVATQVGGGQAGLQVTLNQEGLVQSPAPGFATSSVTPSNGAQTSAVVSSESTPVGSDDEQDESKSDSSSSSSSEEENVNIGAGASSSEGGEAGEDSNISQNLIEQRFGGSPSPGASQGSHTAGYVAYGPPSY